MKNESRPPTLLDAQIPEEHRDTWIYVNLFLQRYEEGKRVKNTELAKLLRKVPETYWDRALYRLPAPMQDEIITLIRSSK